jgi:hypothetical protein
MYLSYFHVSVTMREGSVENDLFAMKMKLRKENSSRKRSITDACIHY